MTLINQDGKALFFDTEKFSVKLQSIGEENSFGSLCAVSIRQEKLMPRPLAVGFYRSREMAANVAKELLSAAKSGKPYFIMPPVNLTALELFEHIAAVIFDAPDN